jgi:hypothetical protein
MAQFEQALKLKPDYVEAHNNLGATGFFLTRDSCGRKQLKTTDAQTLQFFNQK